VRIFASCSPAPQVYTRLDTTGYLYQGVGGSAAETDISIGEHGEVQVRKYGIPVLAVALGIGIGFQKYRPRQGANLAFMIAPMRAPR